MTTIIFNKFYNTSNLKDLDLINILHIVLHVFKKINIKTLNTH
jgi:hypothetical protein